MKKKYFILSVLMLAVIGIFLSNYPPAKTSAQAPMGYLANVSSTTWMTITGGTAQQILASSSCISRIITIPGTEVFYTTEDSALAPSVGIGHKLTASSTTVLDSGLYGCGKVTAFSASTTKITVTEFTNFK